MRQHTRPRTYTDFGITHRPICYPVFRVSTRSESTVWRVPMPYTLEDLEDLERAEDGYGLFDDTLAPYRLDMGEDVER